MDITWEKPFFYETPFTMRKLLDSELLNIEGLSIVKNISIWHFVVYLTLNSENFIKLDY